MTAEAGERRRSWGRLAAAAMLLLALVGSPWWGPRALARMAFFRIRKIEIDGTRYLLPDDVLARLKVDTSASVWTDLDALERRVVGHPQVARVEIGRRLPGTLVVRVTENLPVALVPVKGGLQPLDSAGGALPIDPSQVSVDLPIVARRDTTVLRLLAEVRRAQPALFARISEAGRVGRDELLLRLDSMPVRAMVDVGVDRLAEIDLVESDLARRQARVAELDLRYRDQVIARLQ